jgi:hypothetical protein
MLQLRERFADGFLLELKLNQYFLPEEQLLKLIRIGNEQCKIRKHFKLK